MEPKISSVVCTHNRAMYLSKAIKSLINQTLPKEQYEIIVVDNASKDNTKDVLKEFRDIQNLKYVYEPTLGLAHARNTGWRSAKGKYVAYLDDDAVASPKWLEMILSVFEMVKPQPGCVGGRIEPIWEAPRPLWLSDKMLLQLAILSWSNGPIFLNDKQWLAGINMALPKKILEEINGFAIGFDATGKKLLSGGDILLQRELAKMGYQCFYHPEILVWHHIAASRLSKDWFVKKAFWQGVSDASIRVYEERPSALLRLWKGIKALLRILLSPRDLTALIIPTDCPERLDSKRSAAARIGHILYLWGLVR